MVYTQQDLNKNLIVFIKQYEGAIDGCKQITNLEKGYCSGHATLRGYARLIDKLPNPKNVARDDLAWWNATNNTIGSWNRRSSLNEAAIQTFRRYLSLIEWFQNIENFRLTLFASEEFESVSQGDLDKLIADTAGRILYQNYSLAAAFTEIELTKVFEEVLPDTADETLILVSSHNHDTEFVIQNNEYYFYDPNNAKGELRLRTVKDLAKHIFDSNFSKEPLYLRYANQSPIGLRAYSFQNTVKNLNHIQLLGDLSILGKFYQSFDQQYNALHVAIKIGCTSSFSVIIQKLSRTIMLEDSKNLMMRFIAYKGRFDIFIKLMAVNKQPLDYKLKSDLLKIAMKKKRYRLAEYLLKNYTPIINDQYDEMLYFFNSLIFDNKYYLASLLLKKATCLTEDNENRQISQLDLENFLYGIKKILENHLIEFDCDLYKKIVGIIVAGDYQWIKRFFFTDHNTIITEKFDVWTITFVLRYSKAADDVYHIFNYLCSLDIVKNDLKIKEKLDGDIFQLVAGKLKVIYHMSDVGCGRAKETKRANTQNNFFRKKKKLIAENEKSIYPFKPGVYLK